MPNLGSRGDICHDHTQAQRSKFPLVINLGVARRGVVVREQEELTLTTPLVGVTQHFRRLAI